MSDVMLHGVLNMPPEMWQDSDLDNAQRFSRYQAASRRILDDEREIARLRAEVEALRGAVLAEREACAKLCETLPVTDDDVADQCAAAIRARGGEK